MRQVTRRQVTSGQVTWRRWMGTAAGVALAASLTGAWLHQRKEPPRGMVYSAAGYGGYVPAAPTTPASARVKTAAEKTAAVKRRDAISPAIDAYGAGRYDRAEKLASAFLAASASSGPSPQADRTPPRPSPQAGRELGALGESRARAWWVLAYSAARRNELGLARERFASLEAAAATLPDGGRPDEGGAPAALQSSGGAAGESGPDRFDPAAARPSDEPSLEEEAAYEHAVCTAALGDHPGAEREYRAFMRRYPDSPLVSASMKRIALFHHGDLPKNAEADWRAAMSVQRAHALSQARELSLCGPACLAELMRRQGKAADIHTLATEMKTDDRGTSLIGLAEAVKRRGFSGKGLQVTTAGLLLQRTPFVAVLKPGHYVLVDAVRADGVIVWDPDANGPARGGQRALDAASWKQAWNGLLLTLE